MIDISKTCLRGYRALALHQRLLYVPACLERADSGASLPRTTIPLHGASQSSVPCNSKDDLSLPRHKMQILAMRAPRLACVLHLDVVVAHCPGEGRVLQNVPALLAALQCRAACSQRTMRNGRLATSWQAYCTAAHSSQKCSSGMRRAAQLPAPEASCSCGPGAWPAPVPIAKERGTRRPLAHV